MNTPAEEIYDEYARFDASNQIHHTAIIYPCVKMGKNNIVGPYSVIGSNGEIRGVNNFEGEVIIGDGNVISELVTIQRPAEAGKATRVGDNNIIMAHAHLGHDVQIGNKCEVCTSTVLGGYVVVEDEVKIKLHCVIRNRKRIGKGAIVGMGSVVTKDVEPGAIVVGNPAKLHKK